MHEQIRKTRGAGVVVWTCRCAAIGRSARRRRKPRHGERDSRKHEERFRIAHIIEPLTCRTAMWKRAS